MALHRDIFWVGKQWAVTGYGIQACNQKQRSQFDIAASRLWDDGVQDAIRAEKWVNPDDFEKAVAAARKYYPEPPRKTPPPAEPAPPSKPMVLSEVPPKLPEAPAKLATPEFDMRLEGVRAKLTPVWRIRTRVAVRQDN
jgi:hypothetical protein